MTEFFLKGPNNSYLTNVENIFPTTPVEIGIEINPKAPASGVARIITPSAGLTIKGTESTTGFTGDVTAIDRDENLATHYTTITFDQGCPKSTFSTIEGIYSTLDKPLNQPDSPTEITKAMSTYSSVAEQLANNPEVHTAFNNIDGALWEYGIQNSGVVTLLPYAMGSRLAGDISQCLTR